MPDDCSSNDSGQLRASTVSKTFRSGRIARVTTWRGRRLPRPTEDLEDQGLGFDVQTALHRRSVLRGVGLGAFGMGLVACDRVDISPSRRLALPAQAAATRLAHVPGLRLPHRPASSGNGGRWHPRPPVCVG
jgi:hypothetical protein